MSNSSVLQAAIAALSGNPEQLSAVNERGHCVVLAGPGSGKTKTLTTAIARSLAEDIAAPRGIACITYSNECSLELENRLVSLGVETHGHVFVGTVHGFALAHVIVPYARCTVPELRNGVAVATRAQCRAAVEAAHARTIGGGEDPHRRWRFAEEKRRSQVDRSKPEWRERNPELMDFIEAYEAELRSLGVIDFDDMPLLAFRLIQAHPWIGQALAAKFPALFVDEYQDLGHALHALVLELCFKHGVRLFAVGDADQSIYAFTGANPELLRSLTERTDVATVRLRLNYRCGTTIISASMAALGEDRGYVASDDTHAGEVVFYGSDGGLADQANAIVANVLPAILARGIPLHEIAILYRTAAQGAAVSNAAVSAGYPVVRADNQALVRRNSRVARFVEGCAQWVSGGWKLAVPRFQKLVSDAVAIVHGHAFSDGDRQAITAELAEFLKPASMTGISLNQWLIEFRRDVLEPWRRRATTAGEDFSAVDEMIERTDVTGPDHDLSVAHFGGHIQGSGRLNLSTLHSAKGREFDAVILFAMNNDVLPEQRDTRNAGSLREARRLFYVGVTRPRKLLYACYRNKGNSPWVRELYDRINAP